MPHMAERNPVAKAIAVRRMQSVLTDQQIELHVTPDGADATSLLAHLGWQLGLAAQTAVFALGTDSATTRRLHGALRTAHDLCLRGYLWQAALAPALDQAMSEAHEVLLAYPDTAQHFIGAADHLAALIRAHRVQRDSIVGAELYQQPALAHTASQPDQAAA